MININKELFNWFITKPGYLKSSNNKILSIFDLKDNKDNNKIINNIKKQVKLQIIKNKQFKAVKSISSTNTLKETKSESKIIKISNFNKNNVLIIGDTHEPFCKEGYLEHCIKVKEKYNCNKIVHIGDLVDNHAVSYHESDPDGRSPGDEFKLALDNCQKWYKAFPEVFICIGNHDRLPFRKAYTAGLPKNWLKSYQEMFNSPKGWKWDFVHKIDGVIYQHGTGMSGEMASVNAARENRQSTVIGHLHTVCNTRFLASEKDLIFGMSVGCGIDHTKYAFAYGKENTRKPVLSCSVVLDGKMPINIPMEI